MEEKSYAWSLDKRCFVNGCESADKAVKEAYRESDGEKSVFIGLEKTPTFNIDADTILEIIDEQYLEESSDWYDGYLTTTITHGDKLLLEKRIKETIDKWMEDTNNYPTFFTVTNVEEIVFEEYLNDKEF